MTTLERTIARDRLWTTAGLVTMTLLAWAWLVREAARMNGMAAEAHMHIAMGMADMRVWDAAAWLGLFMMWSIMMVAMMLPSAAPLIVLVLGTYRRRNTAQARLSAYAFLGGYLCAWTAFSAVAALAQVVMHRGAVMSPDMRVASSVIASVVLIAAGVYQWLPIKNMCLSHCRSPLGFMMSDWREGIAGAFAMGLRYAAWCVVCCWLVMAVLFVAGAMSIAWAIAISLYVLLERLLPLGRRFDRAMGAALVALGLWRLVVPA